MRLIQQAEAAECALACLAMIAAHHGRDVSLVDLRREFSTSLRGAALDDLIGAASRLGLVARPVRIELDELPSVRFPIVAHWDLKHFVVIKGKRRGGFDVFDPAKGVRRFALDELSAHLTGVLVEFDPNAGFEGVQDSQRLRLRDFLQGQSGVAGAFAQLLGLALLLQLVGIASPLYVQFVVDEVLIKRDVALLGTLALGFALLLAVQLVVKTLRALVLLYAGNQLGLNLTAALMRRLLRLPLAYFEKRHQGDVLSRIRSLTPVREFLTRGAVDVVLNVVTLGVAVSVMLAYDGLLTAVVIASVLVHGVIKAATLPILKKRSQEQIQNGAEEQSHVIESLATVQAIKLGNLETAREQRWHQLFLRNINTGVSLERLRIALVISDGVLTGAEQILVVFLGAGLVIDGTLSIGALYAFLAFRSQFADASRGLIDQVAGLAVLRVHLDRLEDIALEKPEATEVNALRTPRPVVRGLALRGVSFRYGMGDPWILREVDLNLNRDQFVVVCGPSGSGKSTLIKILIGLFEPDAGTLLVDGMELSRYGKDLLRRQTGVVMQNDTLFTGTVAENIASFATLPDMARVRSAAEQALVAGEIDGLRLGYESLIGDRGSNLSGGQRQRLVLARALYLDPDILVLDEGTANLPAEIEQALVETLRGRGGLRILVTHRAETAALADVVIRIDRGGRVEQTSAAGSQLAGGDDLRAESEVAGSQASITGAQ